MSLARRSSAGFGLWAGLSLASKRLLAVGTILLLIMVLAVGLAMWNMRVVALADARQTIDKLAIAVSEQTARTVQAVDLVVKGLQVQIQSKNIATPESFDAILGSRALQEELSEQQQSLPQANAFSIIDAQGRLVNSSRRWPILPLSLADRDYYQYFRTHDDRGSFISAPARSRVDGRWTFYLVQRVNGSHGEFLGMVTGAINLDYARDFYRALTAGEDLTVALLDRQGRVLTSYPMDVPIGGRLPPPNSDWDRIVAQGKPGLFEAPGKLLPGLRLISVYPLRDYPLVVNVSESKWQSLANWRREALLAALGTGCAVLCVLLLLRALTLQLRRLESSEVSLAERNARLETAQGRLENQAEALRASEADLAEKSSALGTTLEHMSQGIIMVDAAGTVAVCNRRALELLDLPAELMATRPSLETVVAYQFGIGEFRPDEEIVQRTRSAYQARRPIVYERIRPNGRILEVHAVPLPDGGTVRTYTDVTERRQSEDRIRHLAHHDPLTHLANRAFLQERLEQGIARADADGHSLALLYLDLDRFKLLNDTRGHGAGDRLLVQVAERLQKAATEHETVGRMGGDEFAIVMPLDKPGAPRARTSCSLARAIIDLMAIPFEIDGGPCRLSVSIGIAHYPEDAAGAGDLLRNADIALYQAKADGTGFYRVFDEEMDARQRQLFMLEQDLRLALEREQFAIVYQPIVDTVSGLITGCEALLRWHHPRLGLIPPADFIPLAERLGLVVPIGRWVLESACAEAATWPAETRLAVNLSPVQAKHETLMSDVDAILERTGLAPHRLTLEVTEGVMLEESSSVLGTMRALRALGIRFSLDDFGTGHAGLGYLRRFPFDGIKIDKLFVQDMVDQPDAEAIVGALLAVSHALNLDVIAEGVETEAQLTALRRRRCRHVQGYFVGPPMVPAEARMRLTESGLQATVMATSRAAAAEGQAPRADGRSGPGQDSDRLHTGHEAPEDQSL